MHEGAVSRHAMRSPRPSSRRQGPGWPMRPSRENRTGWRFPGARGRRDAPRPVLRSDEGSGPCFPSCPWRLRLIPGTRLCRNPGKMKGKVGPSDKVHVRKRHLAVAGTPDHPTNGPTFPPKPWNLALRRPMMAGLEWVRFQPGRPGPPAAGGAMGRRTEAFFAGEVLRHAGGVGVISGVSVPGQGESGAATSSLRASRHLEALLYNESNLPGAGRGKGGLPYIPVRPLVVPK